MKNFKFNKKKVITVSLFIILIAIISSGTIAYFTAVHTAENVITTGSLKIEVIETAKTEGSLEEVPFEDIKNAMPNGTYSKIARVKNIGEQPLYLRVYVENSFKLRSGEVIDDTDNLVSLNYDTENWTYKDGYYYYNRALTSQQLSAPLFTEVHFDEDMGNRYQDSTTYVKVIAQATQAANNGNSVFEAKGWPSEERFVTELPTEENS